MKYKKCQKCLKYKLTKYYSKDSGAPDKKYRWCKTCAYAHKVLYRKNNPNSRKVEYINNKEKLTKKRKEWGAKNKEYLRKYYRKRQQENELLRIQHRLRNRFREVLMRNKKSNSKSVLKAVGCTIEFLKLHLESKFKPGMNWTNNNMKGWHIDHIVPLARAKSKLDVIRLFHYTNLQPLWAKDNLSKGAK